jgi:hypothetical protein
MDLLADSEKVREHNADDYTLELPWQPGVIYRPSTEALWRVLGIASATGTDNTFCPPGRYDAACRREAYDGDDPAEAFIGVDAARYGKDKGTIYIRCGGVIWKESDVVKQDSYEYYLRTKQACLKLIERGVTRIHLRADAGGGYGNFVDIIKRDADLQDTDKLAELKIYEVHFGSPPHETAAQGKYGDMATHLYAYAAEALLALRVENPSPKLERDLCERKYRYVTKTVGRQTRLDLKQLTPKEKFKEEFGESPDDGDGFVLACAGKSLFADVAPVAAAPPLMAATSPWDVSARHDDDEYDDE